MDAFVNLAKQGYEAYSESQSNVSKTGGQEYNAPYHSGQDGSSGGNPVNYNHEEVVNHAQNHGSGDPSLYNNALGYINQNQSQHGQPINEQHVQDAHNVAYGQGNASDLSASSMGSAAALQALKKFTSGGSGGGGGGSGGSSQLISLAMAEATKLFDQSGGASSGSKQDAVNSAGMTVMKLMVQSKLSGMTGGGDSGGLGSLMGMASKFM